jgi:hypothetical protein
MLYNAVQSSGVKLSHILERTGYHRSTYYTHIRNPNLSFNILYKYGQAIPYDFSFQFPEIGEYFSRFSEKKESSVQEGESNPYEKMSVESLSKYTHSLKEKYIALLEENRELRIKLDELSAKLKEKTK